VASPDIVNDFHNTLDKLRAAPGFYERLTDPETGSASPRKRAKETR